MEAPFTLDREGTFRLEPRGETERCGELDTSEYHYKVHIAVIRRDKNGWVIDNHFVPEVVERVVGSGFPSCEGFCESVCRYLVEALGDRAVRVEVGIMGIVNAWITRHWERSETQSQEW